MTHHAYDPNAPEFTGALEALRPELLAMRGDQLETIRLEVGAALVTALGANTDLMAFRGRAAAELGEDIAVHFDRNEITAEAYGRAHALHLTTLHGVDLEERVGELNQTRKILLMEAEALVSQKKLSGSVLGELVGGTGYKALCLDVLQLVSALRAAWPEVESFTPMKILELDRAEALAKEVAKTVGENERATSSSSPSGDLRQRAYTLFVRNYEEIRRAMVYLRWAEDDVDDIVPSLFAGKKSRSKKDDDADEIHGATPTTPSLTNGSAPVAPGHPGGSPFVS